MKKRAGFTLVELVIAIAIMAIVLGGLVVLFGQTSMASQTGMNQEQAYEEARVTMEQLKTSLRYADTTSVKNQNSATPAVGDTYSSSSTLTYTGSAFDKHWDVSNGENINYEVKVSWVSGSSNKQINVVIKDTDSNKELKNITFPKNTANGAFKGDGTDFPVKYEKFTTNDSKEVSLYTVTLPVQYKLNGSAKTDTLTSKVNPTDYSNGTVTENPSTPAELDEGANNFVVALNKWESSKSEAYNAEGWSLQSGWDKLTSTQKTLIQNVYNYLKTLQANGGLSSYLGVYNSKLTNFDTSNATIWYQLTNNIPIRAYYKYLSKNHSFPTVTFSNGVTVYTKPYVLFDHDSDQLYNQIQRRDAGFDPPKAILTTGSTNTDELSDDEYIRYIYDSVNLKWYTATTGSRRSKYNLGGYSYSYTSIAGTYYNVLYYDARTEYLDKATILAWVRANWVEIKVAS